MRKMMRKTGWGLMAGLMLSAQLAGAVTWDGGGSDFNWGTALNWNDDANPGGRPTADGGTTTSEGAEATTDANG